MPEKNEVLSVRKVERIGKTKGEPYQALVVRLEDGSLEPYEFLVFLNSEQKRILRDVPIAIS